MDTSNALTEPSEPTELTGKQTAGTGLPIVPAATQPVAMTVQEEDDVIDSAWIEKAKQIVAATSGDPHKQSQQLATLKAEYLQKRYNKSITTT